METGRKRCEICFVSGRQVQAWGLTALFLSTFCCQVWSREAAGRDRLGFPCSFGLVDNRVGFFQPDPFRGNEQIHLSVVL